MKNKLEVFIEKIESFTDLKPAEQIDFFVYFLLIINKANSVIAKDITYCFSELHLLPYSNISAYLNNNTKGKKAKFLKNKNGFLLSRYRKLELDKKIVKIVQIKPTDDLFPIDLLQNTRGYLGKTAVQAIVCYDKGLYDACLVMIRRLIETLIIECFERYSLESKIKDRDGHFLFLNELIGKFLSENKWTLGRNTAKSLPKIKALGDLSAHNRRYNARKSDIDKIQSDLRIVIEDLINIIDYQNWNKS